MMDYSISPLLQQRIEGDFSLPLEYLSIISGIKIIVVMSRTIGWHRQITTNTYLLMYCSYMNVSYLKVCPEFESLIFVSELACILVASIEH